MLVRRGTRHYWYATERVDGRVVRTYIASGAEALRCARRARKLERLRRETKADCDDLKARLRAFKADQAEEVAAFVAGVQELSRNASAAFQDVEAAFKAEMNRRGFWQHARGAWRKRREKTMATTNLPAEGGAAPALARAPGSATEEPRLAALVLGAAAGLLTRGSEDPEVQRRIASVVAAEYRQRAGALGGEDADALVRLCAHRVALAAAECDVLNTIGANQHPGEISPQALRKLEWAREGADKRFHRAVRSLDMVRNRAHRPAAVVAVAVSVPGDGR
jgi:hypothetical protein